MLSLATTAPGTVEGALMAVAIGVGAVILLIIAFVLLARSGGKDQAAAAASTARSVPGTATVQAVSAEPYDQENATFRPYRFDLVVRPEGRPPYETQVLWNVGLLGAPNAQVGAEVEVTVDPEDPRLVRPVAVDMMIKATFEHQVLKGFGQRS